MRNYLMKNRNTGVDISFIDVVRKVASGVVKVGVYLCEEGEKKMEKLEREKERAEVRASKLTDKELFNQGKNSSDTMTRAVYAKELKNRGYFKKEEE